MPPSISSFPFYAQPIHWVLIHEPYRLHLRSFCRADRRVKLTLHPCARVHKNQISDLCFTPPASETRALPALYHNLLAVEEEAAAPASAQHGRPAGLCID